MEHDYESNKRIFKTLLKQLLEVCYLGAGSSSQ